MQVSSSSEPAVTTTTPFCLLSTGVGSNVFGAEVAEGGRFAGVKVPAAAAAALHLASSSTSFFFFSALKAISAQKEQYVRINSVSQSEGTRGKQS